MIEKVELCDKYITWLNVNNQKILLNELLERHNLNYDEKVISFLKIPIDKDNEMCPIVNMG